ncbi:MAG: Glucose 1-dehydrogenase 2 [Anaerolineales bacterium]|nr:Glucose 1-dehydrogenase 2 [Anaerolineales bacterium]
MKLANKVAVITGSTRGLGRAIAEACVREDASIVVSSRTPAAVEETAQSLTDMGGTVLGVPCDVGNLTQVQDLADRAIERFGHIDIWVNNAALSGPYGRTLDKPIERYETVLRANTLGTYYGSRVALEQMLPRGAGKLINLSGRGADSPAPFQNAYAPTKAWVGNFTQGLAQEYADHGVDIILFNPGMVLTDMLTDVEIVGDELPRRFKYFPRILRMWANAPEVPAEKAVEIAANGENGKTYKVLTRRRLVAGALAELWRIVTRSDEPLPDVDIRRKPVEL